MRGRSIFMGVLALLTCARRAGAYRPFDSTDAAVADPGEVEIELGYAGFRQSDRGVTIVAPTFVGNLGIAPNLEAVGEFKLASDLTRSRGEDPTRFEESEVSLKWVLRDGVLQDGSGPSLAMELSALLPTGREEDRFGGELVAIASGRTLGWTWHLNVGALVEPQRSDPGVIWGAIAEHTIRGPLRAVAEIDGESVRGARPDDSALVGLIWTVPAPAPFHELAIDVGVRRGISNAADDWGGTAGVTFAFSVGRATKEENAP
jgi:hypothetical protein